MFKFSTDRALKMAREMAKAELAWLTEPRQRSEKVSPRPRKRRNRR